MMRVIQAQLYIGDLDPSSKELDLYNLLRSFGEVSLIKFLRTPAHQYRSYAFVAFNDPSSASKARRELNGIKFFNTYIRVCRVTKDRDPKANIFIKNIPATATIKDLEDRFSSFGSIISSKISYDKHGNSLSYGFLQYEKREKALDAIKQMNGTVWDDCILSVCEFMPLTSRNIESKSNLYIKGFPLSFTQDDIKQKFCIFGAIVSIGLMTAKTKDGERPFGFISFSAADSASAACKQMHGLKDQDFEWHVVPHMNKNIRKAVLKDQYSKQIEEWKVKNLYIKNLHKTICEKKLKEICVVYGEITSIKIATVEHIRYSADGDLIKEYSSKGVGFVCYSLEVSATKALKGLQDKTIEGQKLYLARWKPKVELIRLYKSSLRNSRFLSSANSNSGQSRPGPNQQSYIQGYSGVPAQPQGLNKYSESKQYPSRPGQYGPGYNKPQVPYMQGSIRRPPLPFSPATPMQVHSKDSIGEALYPIVVKHTNELVAGKITGMMLEMGIPMLSRLMRDESTLHEKILEAVEVLRKAWQNNPAQLSLLPNSNM
jgi:polyadenylate-binding protein